MKKSKNYDQRKFNLITPPAAILVVGAVIFYGLTAIEAPIVAALMSDPWVSFEKIMSRSIYEGGAFGGSDVGVTCAILCFLVWIARRGANSEVLYFSRQEFKFVWLASLTTSIILVHSLKWIIIRVRPKLFFSTTPAMSLENANLESLRWPGFLSFNAPRGIGWNSFPSGHTASSAILLCFAYIFYRKNRALGLGIGMGVFLYCVAMSIARSMAGMHWLTDGVASFFGVWAIIHEISVRMKIHSSK